MARIGEAAKLALADADVADFLRWYVDSGTLRLSGLLGAFTPPEHLFTLAREVNLTLQALVDLAAAARTVRRDLTDADLTLIATQIGALDVGDRGRTRELEAPWRAVAQEVTEPPRME